MRRSFTFILIFLMQQHFVHAQAGTPDSTFDFDGIVTHSINGSDDKIWSVALQPDGKIVAAGYSYAGTLMNFALSRYLADGSLDTSFSSNGIVTDTLGTSLCAFHGVVVQPDGKIVAAGFARINLQDDMVIARYNSDGSIDAGFGIAGKTKCDFNGMHDDILAVALQPDGKIIAAGVAGNPQLTGDFALVRLNTDGTPDTSFSNDGKTNFNFGTGAALGTAMALQPDGKIVISGYTADGNDNDFALARINSNGELDSAFGNYGKQITAITPDNENSFAVALQTDGKIVLAGFAIVTPPYYQFAVVRYLDDGNIDTTFSNDGIAITSFGNYNDYPRSMIIQQDGKILVAGSSSTGLQNDFALARYNINGTLDSAFGMSGKVITAVSTESEAIYSLQQQTDGKIIAGGFALSGGNSQFALVRYLNDAVAGEMEFPFLENSVRLYPNPAAQNITLSYSISRDELISIDLFNLQGKHLQNFADHEMQLHGTQYISLSTGNILPGCYFLRISAASASYTVKLIK
jgi:uncharacterized delta-60 repeat protein